MNIVARPVTGIVLLICLAVLLSPVIRPLLKKKKGAAE